VAFDLLMAGDVDLAADAAPGARGSAVADRAKGIEGWIAITNGGDLSAVVDQQ